MDFNDSPEEAAFRQEVRAWLAANAGPRAPKEDLEAARAWQAKKAAAGYAQITWPREWGGGGGTAMQQVIFSQEESRLHDSDIHFGIGLGMCVPTVMAFADEATKQRFVGPAVRGDEIWCQLFSEPAAGSDLAGLRTRAVSVTNDQGQVEWVINGQKVWTSGAQNSDYGLLLARSNPELPKHKGLTMFWMDMRAPGVEVRPIHQMSGASHFNEVYFTDLRIPDSQRLGAVDDGWRVGLVTLMNERLAVSGITGPGYEQIVELARMVRTEAGTVLDDQGFRERLADWFVQAEGLKYTRFRTMTSLSRGEAPGPESSIGKIIQANQLQDMSNQAVEALEEYGILSDPALAPLTAIFHDHLLSSPGLRIAGGTDEILKNIIAERVLELPGDIRVDKTLPFRDLPVGRA